jgi:cell division GTPase FtsZ
MMEKLAYGSMDISSCAVAVTDTRYRIDSPNSKRRFIEVVGLGNGGEEVAKMVDARQLADVHVVIPDANRALQLLDGTDMLFIITCDGDDVSLAPVFKQAARKLGVQVTGIFIHDAAVKPEPVSFAALRAASDILVIASSRDYAIDMLIQLGA